MSDVVAPKKSWKPTKKLIASTVTGLASIAASWIVTGAFDDVERGMTATLVVAVVTAYFKSNDDVPAGVPVAAKKPRSYGKA